MKRNDEFDEILDEALIEYRGAEPLSGLEDRVLRRLQDRRRNRGAWLTWSLATALAIALFAVIAWFLPKKHGPEQAEQPSSTQWTSASTPENIAAEPPKYTGDLPRKVHRERHSGVIVNSNPSTAVRRAPVVPEQFPSPASLSSDERVCLRLARTDPQVLQTLPRRDAEIAIAPIEIEPLAEETPAIEERTNAYSTACPNSRGPGADGRTALVFTNRKQVWRRVEK